MEFYINLKIDLHSVFHLGYLLSIMWYLPLHFDWDGESGASWRAAAVGWLRELRRRAYRWFMRHTCKWWRCAVRRCLRPKREAGTCSWAFLEPSMVCLSQEKAKIRSVTSLGFISNIYCRSLAKSRLRWKPPAISHRMPSCWSSSGSSTASHCCNLQINIYDSACSGGLSGSRPSGKIEERAWLCNGATLAACAGAEPGGESQTELCLVLS